jgi:hypothetical protein
MTIVMSWGKHSMQNLFIDHYLSKGGGESGTKFGRKTAEEFR